MAFASLLMAASRASEALAMTTWRWHSPGILLADTITKLPVEAEGAVLVSGSHGGRYPGYLAARAGARAVILNDAGVGLDDAGIGALPYLEALGIAAATVSHRSCRIGDTADMVAHGVISYANAPARAAGVTSGSGCCEAMLRLPFAPRQPIEPPSIGESRSEFAIEDGRCRILLLDSASLVRPEDTGRIIVTGSHGGLIGNDPKLALRTDAEAAVFNDAGRPDGPGTARLPALDSRGIAAVTVSAASARIGDAASALETGVISSVNVNAEGAGARPGATLLRFLIDLARHCSKA